MQHRSASVDRLSQYQLRSARAATTLDYITGTAVLEFGPAETLPPVRAMPPANAPSLPTTHVVHHLTVMTELHKQGAL
jgi:hypothetical protein